MRTSKPKMIWINQSFKSLYLFMIKCYIFSGYLAGNGYIGMIILPFLFMVKDLILLHYFYNKITSASTY